MTVQAQVNIHGHIFDVSVSFAGEHRKYVGKVAGKLVKALGSDTVFYDKFYEAQLAGPNLDTRLQSIYTERSKLVVVFLSKYYATKTWCGIEFRAIRDIVNRGDGSKLMYFRFDDAEIEGVLPQDGYIDANANTTLQTFDLICQRLQHLR